LRTKFLELPFEGCGAAAARREKDKKIVIDYYLKDILEYRCSEEFIGSIGATIFDIMINSINNLGLLKIDKIKTKDRKKKIFTLLFQISLLKFLTKKYIHLLNYLW